jgi:hypothetical protein
LEPRKYGNFSVHHFGATHLGPGNLTICIGVATDAERQEIIDSGIDPLVRAWLVDEGYPQDAIKHIGVSVDSQETVDRDWNGDWHQYYQ